MNETLGILATLSCRTIFRMNLVRDLNMVEPENYAKMIKKSNPSFVEIKGFMSVGFARQRLGYDRMPTNKEMEDFIEKLLKELGEDWKLLDRIFLWNHLHLIPP